MSFEDIKSEIAAMAPERQDQLAAYLISLRHQRDPRIAREIRTKIEDKDPSHWLSLGELKEKWKD